MAGTPAGVRGAVIRVRHETEDDAAAVREVNEQAFGGPAEADLVDALRRRRAVTLSLVAVDGAAVVGHILFSPAEIASGRSAHPAVALGPMAVLPAYQQQGVGTRLVRRGLEELKREGHSVAVLVGHPRYYPRFGFIPAGRLGIRCPFEVPDDAFMALELEPGAWQGGSGTVRYQPEFEAG